MVNFSIFNELSLPLEEHNAKNNFLDIFKLLSELQQYGLNKLRMDKNFKDEYILPDITFQQFLGQQQDREFKTRLISFISNTLTKVETPIIKNDEQKQLDSYNSCEYILKNRICSGGLACGDIWNTLVISFNSKKQWCCSFISINKNRITANGSIEEKTVSIKHASNNDHLKSHQDFFGVLEKEKNLNITQNNFWQNRKINFPKIIEFCPEVESQLDKLDTKTFKLTVSLLRDVETERKKITDFHHSGEGQTVRNNPNLKNVRMFTVSSTKVFFENHVKSLPNSYRIYFLEKGNNIYIGYIGKHLKNKTDN